MTTKQVEKLHANDQVFWNDPDAGLCSKLISIQTIRIRARHAHDAVVEIVGTDGSELECWASELS